MPKNPDNIEHSASFIAFANQVYKFGIRAEFSISGIVGFDNASAVIRVPKGSDQYPAALRIFADAQSPQSLIEIELSDSLRKIKTEFDYAGRTLNLLIPEEVVEAGQVTGHITITNVETGCTDLILLDVDHQEAVAIYPSVIRFNQIDDANPDTRIGRLIVHNRNPSADSKSPSAATFMFGETQIAAKLIASKGGVSHYELTLDASKELFGNNFGKCVN